MDKHFEKQTNVVLEKNKRTNISKKKKCSFGKSSFLYLNEWMNIKKKKSKCNLAKNKRTNISKNSKMQFGEKTNGQTFQKTDKCSFRKKQTDKHFKKKKQHAVFRSLASKNESANFSKKQTNAVLKEKNERTNITTSNIEFEGKTNGQTFRKTDKCSFRKKQTDKHFKKKKMQFW